jgi:hypothetical protein
MKELPLKGKRSKRWHPIGIAMDKRVFLCKKCLFWLHFDKAETLFAFY